MLFHNNISIIFRLFFFFHSFVLREASELPKCKPADETCIPQTLTRILRHTDRKLQMNAFRCVSLALKCPLFLEYPEFNIPNLDPFKMKKPSVLRTRNPNSPISLVIHNSNVTM